MSALRLFFAVPVAAQSVPSLNTLHSQWQRRQGWRWPHPGSWHITLAFLGSTESALLPALNEIGLSASTLSAKGRTTLTQFEWWPTIRRPRLLVATGDASPTLTTLYQNLSTALTQRQITFDKRPLRPHVTLARLQGGAQLPEALPSCTEDIPIDRLALYRSDPGLHYRIVWQRPLAGA